MMNYLIRSQKDGKYLVARVQNSEDRPGESYLLLFTEDYQALSYINTHGQSMSDRLTVESASPTQIKSLLQRWGYQGLGLVTDPLLPTIEFMLPD
ncbi:MAG: hypothetical protein ACFCU5_00325 [Pleurocapsa sp.]